MSNLNMLFFAFLFQSDRIQNLWYFYPVKTVKKFALLAFIFVALLALGFYRDFVFKSINALLQAWDHDMDYQMPRSLQFFEDYEYDTIVNMKWILTLLFSLFYLLLAIFTIRILFDSKGFVRITIASYAGIVIISALFILTGLMMKGSSEKMYEFARYMMGLAQSPIILMILIPVFRMYEKEKPEIQKK
jgi:hypothetical protein